MIIALGSDHAGFQYKERIAQYLQELGHEVLDFGTHSPESTDFPLYVIPAAEAVAHGKADRAIVFGGSGNGEAMAANKVKGIRCALCWCDESAEFACRHNNANVISMGQRMISIEIAMNIVKIWLQSPFDGTRHQRRIEQVERYEEGLPLEVEGLPIKAKAATPA